MHRHRTFLRWYKTKLFQYSEKKIQSIIFSMGKKDQLSSRILRINDGFLFFSFNLFQRFTTIIIKDHLFRTRRRPRDNTNVPNYRRGTGNRMINISVIENRAVLFHICSRTTRLQSRTPPFSQQQQETAKILWPFRRKSVSTSVDNLD